MFNTHLSYFYYTTKFSSYCLLKKWINNDTSQKCPVLTIPAKVSCGCKSSASLENHGFGVVQSLSLHINPPLSFSCPETSRVEIQWTVDRCSVFSAQCGLYALEKREDSEQKTPKPLIVQKRCKQTPDIVLLPS